MTYYYQLRTFKLTVKDGWISTFDSFDTLTELQQHIEHIEKFVPIGVPECLYRTFEIRRIYT